MRKIIAVLTGVLIASALAACTPTSTESEHQHRTEPPAGAVQESTVDGALEKEQMVVDADPTVTVCIYSVNEDNTGLKQNMDAVDGEELEAQALIDRMAELGVLEDGIEVLTFENKDGALTLDLSSLKEQSDELVIAAITNTFIQNFEADEITLSVAGQKVGDGPFEYIKNYKQMK